LGIGQKELGIQIPGNSDNEQVKQAFSKLFDTKEKKVKKKKTKKKTIKKKVEKKETQTSE